MFKYFPSLLGGLVSAVVLAVAFLIRDIIVRRRSRRQQRWQTLEEDDSLSLAQKVDAAQPPADWRGRLDYNFRRMLHRTGLGLAPDQAVAIMTLAAVALAGGLVLWREELWLIGMGVALGVGLPLVILLFLQGQWRQRNQAQLPDAFFQLARS